MKRTRPNGGRVSTADIERGYLPTNSAAEYLGLSVAYLRLLRARGSGPAFYRLGRRIVYTRDDLNNWTMAFRISTRVTTTQQTGAAACGIARLEHEPA